MTVWCGWQERIWAASTRSAQERRHRRAGFGPLLAHRKSIAMKFKVGTTAYQRKTKTQRDVIVTIVIDETALARVLGERAINNRSKESKVLRGIIRGGVHIL
jgi:hypothetical protein